MADEPADNPKKTCFVIMGFNKKTDFETGRTLDLDKSYRNMIKPGVEDAGLECVRADEIVHSGLIDVPMYERLLKADVVVADLSTSNRNAFYELGVRHALRPFTTVVICEDGAKSAAFDVNHIVIRPYHHLGEDIGFDEAMRFREELKEAIIEIMSKTPEEKRDSPVYRFIEKLNPPFLGIQAGAETIAAAAGAVGAAMDDALGGGSESDKREEDQFSLSHSMLLEQVDQAQKEKDFATAKALLSGMRKKIKEQFPEKPEDPYLVQRLALVTYKSKLPNEQTALEQARELLRLLQPDTSNDTETLGLWGGVHKRLCELTKDETNLDEAVRGYERGFFLRNDYYNGINLAFMLNVRAKALADKPAEAIADFVQAERIRREVIAICNAWLAENAPAEQGASAKAEAQHQGSKYWVLATLAEAYFGLGDDATGEQWLKKAYDAAPADWMKDSTKEQLDKLKPLLADSPLKRIT